SLPFRAAFANSRWMSAEAIALEEALRFEARRLLVYRTRVALCFGLPPVVTFAATNNLWGPARPLWSAVLNRVTAPPTGIAFALLTRPSIQRHAVPFAVAIFAFGSCTRAAAGIGHGDVATTAITLVGLAFVGASTMPWGAGAQIATAAIAGAAIMINSYFVT